MSSSLLNSERNLPRDPPLTAVGEAQIKELGAFFRSLPKNEQPQLVVSSPYTRCVRTAIPVVEGVECPLVIEPGLAEWFAPVWPENTGAHGTPPSGEHVANFFPQVDTSWTPLLYPDPLGETVEDLHHRMYECLRRIDARCKKLGVERVLIVSHAASIIALGRMLLGGGRYGEQKSYPVLAGTASVSKYVAENCGANEDELRWVQAYNGNTSFLQGGSQREWDFSFVPENITEHGLGLHWEDVYLPENPRLIFKARSRL
ncbi:hypothetical protein MVES1_002091 [Malassezia vespertilionis]|uniref:Uncharacterized protein n=1 Tax=Malassezia vespertilionis TaxID=2020962 RepID=A0A2N1JB58_9BASI|nr:uncharacterized protein MVES1_002091 [Malassezia vespertilionis]PKI83777.1 hypothetical protein MVES_001976 [Malassezia vespertilionis]WFD06737.1 hypothetical protein MVES1_002091 [Malassezia vespertilionis]